MKFASVCSGIEAASVAWHPLGFRPVWFAEIADVPSKILAERWPEVPNLGDFTRVQAKPGDFDLLVGGTPCQSFSLAGLRKGLDDDRGNLALEFCRLLDRARPQWFVWENVPGALSSHEGRDFGSFLGALGEIGFGVAWRVLDARFFGVAQRRRRIYVVGRLGDWRGPAAVLFERPGGGGSPGSGKEKKSPYAPGTSRSFGASNLGRVVGFDSTAGTPDPIVECHPTLRGHSGGNAYAHTGVVVGGRARRLRPVEAERIMGFPDGYTDVAGLLENDRFGALANSMAVPVMRWIGQRLYAVDSILEGLRSEVAVR